jgi:hypothetical protein
MVIQYPLRSRIRGRIEDDDEDKKPQVRGKRPWVQAARSGWDS